MNKAPAVGSIVHYTSYGTPGGEYTRTCRAAIVTEVGQDGWTLGLAVFNPTGTHYARGVGRSDQLPASDAHPGGSWHWPERVLG
ncbi:hypothetical protein [Bailinhaonella thermotolerans]|uniref:hypothetical protein n=1 Tax=Bailinhaonella thermotolerans TaxID=1070861 RepID=UPI00192A6796|nr:hypothetical protein [Bailinhaonella thermotolerans]